MKYVKLGNSELETSIISLGTMTFGEQTSKESAFSILDYSIDQGVNLIDTAEMYPIYPKKDTFGLSEKFIGEYLEITKKRSKVLIATKVASRHPEGIGATGLPWIRDGGKELRFDKKNIELAINGSLKRLKTDYIDLYQLHWPERTVPITSRLDYVYNPNEVSWTPFIEVLQILNEFVNLGKIKYFGISNETPWGMTKFIDTAERFGLPRPVSIQNSYNLINRVFDIGNSEVSIREGCKLLAYSPLAGGRLSGKYNNGNRPDDSRYTMWPGSNSRHLSPKIESTIEKYAKLAKDYEIPLSKMAIAFVMSRPYVGSVILGAKSLDQIKQSIESTRITLSNEILLKIEDIHCSCPNPIF